MASSPHPRSLFTPRLVETVAGLYVADIDLYAEKVGLPTLVTPTGG